MAGSSTEFACEVEPESVHGELIIARVNWAGDEINLRLVCISDGDGGHATGRGRLKAVVAQNLLLKQQLLMLRRRCRRASNLGACQRVLLGFWTLFLNPQRILRNAVILKPSTLLRCHAALKACKYRWLYSRSRGVQKFKCLYPVASR